MYEKVSCNFNKFFKSYEKLKLHHFLKGMKSEEV